MHWRGRHTNKYAFAYIIVLLCNKVFCSTALLKFRNEFKNEISFGGFMCALFPKSNYRDEGPIETVYVQSLG